MRLELSEAISLILALPSLRSNNEGQRKMGEKALEFLMEYKDLGVSDKDKQFNRAMIGSVISTVRAFSVERDRINGVWTSIREIKRHRERYLDVIRNLSPFEKGNYWSRAISIILAAGFTIKWPPSETNVQYGTWIFLLIVIILVILSKVLEIIVSTAFEKWWPVEQQKKWKEESMAKYRELIRIFIDEAIEIYRNYYPGEKILYGYDITDKTSVRDLKKHLIEKHFYF